MPFVPRPGEHVSFPNIQGTVPLWSAFVVVRAHTYLDPREFTYVVELKECS